MKFQRISAKNMYSFRQMEFSFSHRGTTLILGKNLDQSTANGAGKSSILKVLYFALWGKELNGEPIDLIKKRDEKDGIYVELEFEDRGHNYKIVRYRDRKDKEAKTGLDFFINGTLFNGETTTDTQKIIERKLKISPRLFLSSILTAQNESKPFLSLSDSDKKELFSELLDLVVYSKSFDLVKADIAEKEKEIESLNLKIESGVSKIKEKVEELEILEQKNDAFEDDKITVKNKKLKELAELRLSKEKIEDGNLKEILSKISELKKEISEKRIELDQIQVELDDEKIILDFYKKYQSEENEATRGLDKVKYSLQQVIENKQKLEQALSSDKKEILELKKKIKSFRDSELDLLRCNKALNEILESTEIIFSNQMSEFVKEEASLSEKLLLLEKEKLSLEKILEEKTTKKEKALAKVEALSPKKNRKREIEIFISKTIDETDSLLLKKEGIEKESRKRENLEKEINRISKEIEDLDLKKNPYIDLVDLAKSKIREVEQVVETNKKSASKLTADLRYLQFWKAAFSPLGIRSFIFDEVLGLLNQKIQFNLNDLFEGALSVVLESESKTQKGAISNKIDTRYYLSGKETTFGLLSGGEQQRAILAVNLALSEIAESYSGTLMNVKFLDEPFNGIDSSGQIQCFKLFSRLAQTKDLYVISHDESFQQLCPNVIFLVKKEGESKIVDKTIFSQINNNY